MESETPIQERCRVQSISLKGLHKPFSYMFILNKEVVEFIMTTATFIQNLIQPDINKPGENFFSL